MSWGYYGEEKRHLSQSLPSLEEDRQGKQYTHINTTWQEQKHKKITWWFFHSVNLHEGNKEGKRAIKEGSLN